MRKLLLNTLLVISIASFLIAIFYVVISGLDLVDSFHLAGQCSSFQNNPNCPDGGYLGYWLIGSVAISLILGYLILFLKRLRRPK
jgi:high-affinity nickel permease